MKDSRENREVTHETIVTCGAGEVARPLRLETVITSNESWETQVSTTNMLKDKNAVTTRKRTRREKGFDEMVKVINSGNPWIDTPTANGHLWMEQDWMERAVEVAQAPRKLEQKCRDRIFHTAWKPN